MSALPVIPTVASRVAVESAPMVNSTSSSSNRKVDEVTKLLAQQHIVSPSVLPLPLNIIGEIIDFLSEKSFGPPAYSKPLVRTLIPEEAAQGSALQPYKQRIKDQQYLHALIQTADGKAFSVPTEQNDDYKRLQALKQLDLSDCTVSRETFESLQVYCPNLEILDLSFANFVVTTAVKPVQLLFPETRATQSQQAVLVSKASEAMEQIASFSKLRTLQLRGCAVDDTEVSKLASSQSLKCLGLGVTLIVGDNLQLPNQLEEIDLYCCRTLSENIASVISNKPYLRIANLDGTKISWDTLQFSDAIEEVRFSNCYNLSQKVASAISHKPHLRIVNLEITKITWAALKFSDAIEEVNFAYCHKLSEKVALAISNKPHLRIAALGFTKISWATIQFSDAIEEVCFRGCYNLSERVASAISNKPHLRIAALEKTKISWDTIQFSDAIEEVSFRGCDNLSANVALDLSGKPRLHSINIGSY